MKPTDNLRDRISAACLYIAQQHNIPQTDSYHDGRIVQLHTIRDEYGFDYKDIDSIFDLAKSLKDDIKPDGRRMTLAEGCAAGIDSLGLSFIANYLNSGSHSRAVETMLDVDTDMSIYGWLRSRTGDKTITKDAILAVHEGDVIGAGLTHNSTTMKSMFESANNHAFQSGDFPKDHLDQYRKPGYTVHEQNFSLDDVFGKASAETLRHKLENAERYSLSGALDNDFRRKSKFDVRRYLDRSITNVGSFVRKADLMIRDVKGSEHFALKSIVGTPDKQGDIVQLPGVSDGFTVARTITGEVVVMPDRDFEAEYRPFGKDSLSEGIAVVRSGISTFGELKEVMTSDNLSGHRLSVPMEFTYSEGDKAITVTTVDPTYGMLSYQAERIAEVEKRTKTHVSGNAPGVYHLLNDDITLEHEYDYPSFGGGSSPGSSGLGQPVYNPPIEQPKPKKPRIPNPGPEGPDYPGPDLPPYPGPDYPGPDLPPYPGPDHPKPEYPGIEIMCEETQEGPQSKYKKLRDIATTHQKHDVDKGYSYEP